MTPSCARSRDRSPVVHGLLHALCMGVSLLLLLLLHAHLVSGVSTVSPWAVTRSFPGGHSASYCCRQQLLQRQWSSLCAATIYEPSLASCSSSSFSLSAGAHLKTTGVYFSRQRNHQLPTAFVAPIGSPACRGCAPTTGCGHSNSPVYKGRKQQGGCRNSNATGSGGSYLREGHRGNSLALRCLHTGRRSALFAANGTGLSKIPLSTKQLKRREQAEQQEAQVYKVKETEAVKDKEGPEKRRQRVKEWRVVLHNDDIHTFECVENAITKILPQISRARAYDIALHAHTNLKATIMLTWEEKATEIARALQEEGLTVSVLPDKLFSKMGDQKK